MRQSSSRAAHLVRTVLQDRRTDLARFVGIVFLLVICHALLRSLAIFGLGVLALFAPVAFLLFTDKFRGAPRPEDFANFFAAVGVAGALLFLPAISIVCATALMALGTAWIAARYAVRDIEYERSFSVGRIFPGDETSLQIRIINRKLLPLAWIRVDDPIHVRGGSGKQRLNRLLKVSGTIELVEQQLSALINRGAIGPFQAMSRAFPIKALHRGVYAFGPAHVETGDPFGLFSRDCIVGEESELIVYPRIMRREEISPSFWASLGAMMTRRTLFDDPTLLAGSREYSPDDPLNRIHWKATARTGGLQVRVHDPTTTTEIMIVLNLHTYAHAWQGVDPERMEASIEVAASLAAWLLQRDFAVGVRSNGIISDIERTSRVVPSASPKQASVVLEHLARLSYSAGYSAATMLRDEGDRRGANTSIIFVTPLISPDIIIALQAAGLRDRVSVVYCGRVAAPVVPGVKIHLALPSLENARVAS